MAHYETDPFGRIVMICQVCKSKCHGDGAKRVEVLDEGAKNRGRPVYRIAECRRCVCHDCVQTADDPVRSALAPAILGQTMGNPFNLEQALRQVAGEIGLTTPAPQALPRVANCGCGSAAKTRCITCDDPLCAKCVGRHRCGRTQAHGMIER